MNDFANIFRTKLSADNQNQLLKFLSEMGNKATGPEQDALAKMFTGLTSPDTNMQQPNFFGGSLGWNALVLQAYNQYKAGRDLQRDQFNLEKTKYNNAYDNLMEDRRIRAASRASANS